MLTQFPLFLFFLCGGGVEEIERWKWNGNGCLHRLGGNRQEGGWDTHFSPEMSLMKRGHPPLATHTLPPTPLFG